MLLIGLLFLYPFFGVLLIYSGINIAEQNISELSSVNAWNTYKWATWLTFLIALVFSTYGGLKLLFSKSWETVRHITAILWIVGPIESICMGIIIPSISLHYFSLRNYQSYLRIADKIPTGTKVGGTYSVEEFMSLGSPFRRLSETTVNFLIEYHELPTNPQFVIPLLIGPSIIAGIWTVYLLKSKRVRNTYTRIIN